MNDNKKAKMRDRNQLIQSKLERKQADELEIENQSVSSYKYQISEISSRQDSE